MAKEAADKQQQQLELQQQQRDSMCSPPRPGLKCTSSSSLATSGMGGIAAELSPEQDAARNAVRQQQLEKMVKALVARVEKVILYDLSVLLYGSVCGLLTGLVLILTISSL